MEWLLNFLKLGKSGDDCFVYGCFVLCYRNAESAQHKYHTSQNIYYLMKILIIFFPKNRHRHICLGQVKNNVEVSKSNNQRIHIIFEVGSYEIQISRRLTIRY